MEVKTRAPLRRHIRMRRSYVSTVGVCIVQVGFFEAFSVEFSPLPFDSNFEEVFLWFRVFCERRQLRGSIGSRSAAELPVGEPRLTDNLGVTERCNRFLARLVGQLRFCLYILNLALHLSTVQAAHTGKTVTNVLYGVAWLAERLAAASVKSASF